MLPLLVAGTLVAGSVAGAIYAYLASETNAAREAYNRASETYYSTVEELRKDIAKAKAEIHQSFDPFKLIHPLYRQSVATANKTYEAQTAIRNIIRVTRTQLKEMDSKMREMWESIPTFVCNSQREKIHMELKELKAGKQILKLDIQNSKNECDAFLQKVRLFNNETHDLKLFIRDNCGHGGRVWYERKFGAV